MNTYDAPTRWHSFARSIAKHTGLRAETLMNLENALSSDLGEAEVALSSPIPPTSLLYRSPADAFGILVLDDYLRQQLKAPIIQMCLA